ncbi:MAG TPA: Gfo/Idh/MocA family oxidoreductase [Verrucomicrobiae bacterium]|jgi:predicted dehydrogenase|nr:Gfo/Idh/MocA family oxidoreductase [Verrucomicrobiae bacterium]
MKKTQSMRGGLSRRKFLGVGAAAAAFTIVPRHVLGGPGFVPPSEKVNIAIIGCGGQGRTNMETLCKEPDAQIIAVADPIDHFNLDDFYFKGDAGRLPVKAQIEKHFSEKTPNYKVADYEDFRVMLEKEKSIDAILCATPDHQHAYVCAQAMRRGKHVYCEKPLTHNVWEARQISRIARETGVATQMGNQGHAREGIRRTCEIIWDGAIGDVREVHGFTRATRWNKSHVGGRPAPEPTPAGVNWDLWLGARAARPYSSMYSPVRWRDFWDFGTAPIGDFFCHNFDVAFWALDLRAPLTVEASGVGGVDDYIAPPGGIYTYHFGARGAKPPLKFTWYDGGLRPAIPDQFDPEDHLDGDGNGIVFIGDKGMISCAGWGANPSILPDSLDNSYKPPAPTLKRSKGHHRDWLDACKGGAPAGSNFDYGAGLTEVGLLGLVAMRMEKKLHWDAAAMKFTNAPEADKYLKESYRPGWEIV